MKPLKDERSQWSGKKVGSVCFDARVKRRKMFAWSLWLAGGTGSDFESRATSQGTSGNHILVVGVVGAESATGQFQVAFFITVETDDSAAPEESFVARERAVFHGQIADAGFVSIADGAAVCADVAVERTISEGRIAFPVESAVVVDSAAVETGDIVRKFALVEQRAGFTRPAIDINSSAVPALVVFESAIPNLWVASAIFTVQKQTAAAAGAVGFRCFAVGIASGDNEAIEDGACACLLDVNYVVGIVSSARFTDFTGKNGWI